MEIKTNHDLVKHELTLCKTDQEKLDKIAHIVSNLIDLMGIILDTLPHDLEDEVYRKMKVDKFGLH